MICTAASVGAQLRRIRFMGIRVLQSGIILTLVQAGVARAGDVLGASCFFDLATVSGPWEQTGRIDSAPGFMVLAHSQGYSVVDARSEAIRVVRSVDTADDLVGHWVTQDGVLYQSYPRPAALSGYETRVSRVTSTGEVESLGTIANTPHSLGKYSYRASWFVRSDGDRLYTKDLAGDGSAFALYDISNPAAPELLASGDQTPGFLRPDGRFAIDGSRIVARVILPVPGPGVIKALKVFDLSDPEHPVEVAGQAYVPGAMVDWGEPLGLYGDAAVCLRNARVTFVDFSTAQAVAVSTPLDDEEVLSVDSMGSMVALRTIDGVSIVSIEDPVKPRLVSRIERDTPSWVSWVGDGRLAIGSWPIGLDAIRSPIEVLSPSAPDQVARLELPPGPTDAVVVGDEFVYFFVDDQVFTHELSGGVVGSSRSVVNTGAVNPRQWRRFGHLLYLLDSGSIIVLDLTDAAIPSVLGRFGSLSQTLNVTDLLVNGHYGYLLVNRGDSGSWLRVFDLADPSAPVQLTDSIAVPGKYAGLADNRLVFPVKGIAFVFDVGGNPLMPQQVLATPIASDVDFPFRVGDVLCGYDYRSLFLLDVRDPSRPRLSVWSPPTHDPVSVTIVSASPGDDILLCSLGGSFGICGFRVEPGHAPVFLRGAPLSISTYVGDAAGGTAVFGAGFGFATFRYDIGCRGCPGDLAAPWDELNSLDVTAFVDEFALRQPAADLAEPSGVWDFFDVASFLSSYSAGCK